ncbi:hypothetical protein NC661_01235 [Aquibacillus koreensis]|uniref:Uncharacterized protein n=1 Tax=Aquibacillus koreensis TaxID=279446 RepID=A0A9X4AI47_9BACI|nr:hypothetical protein [Aquibacillus koreensis]MCT2537559.1 hypothetical protein [Aquibacillus koreensis]MDC3419005.1 hypothetical protein [Aquibacillus koreensis]
MKKKLFGLSAIIICSLFVAILIFEKDEISVIKFFPIDASTTFSSYGTELRLKSETDQDEYDINWKAYSTLEDEIYLRQDVSLMYTDGKLKGILSKWKENEKDIVLNSPIHGEDSSHYETITFHHGEIHYPDDKIKSIHAMSYDELYVIDSPHSALESFEQPTNNSQKEWKKTLDHATSQQLRYHWKQLIHYFEINKDQYVFVPLTDLYRYENENIPTLSQEQTQQVIGQLWEGLYKNYILSITDNKQPVHSFIPLILFDKKGEHLLVLYQDQNDKMQKLIQSYPSFE